MKMKDIVEWPESWSTPLGSRDANAPVADGILVGLSLWGMSIIGESLFLSRQLFTYEGYARSPYRSAF